MNGNGTDVDYVTQATEGQIEGIAISGLHGFGVYPGLVGKRVCRATQTNQERPLGMGKKHSGQIPLGIGHKFVQLVEGLRLLRVMACQPLDVQTATRCHGVHRRAFYRWLRAFALAGIPIHSRHRGPGPGKEYFLYKKDWAQLIQK